MERSVWTHFMPERTDSKATRLDLLLLVVVRGRLAHQKSYADLSWTNVEIYQLKGLFYGSNHWCRLLTGSHRERPEICET